MSEKKKGTYLNLKKTVGKMAPIYLLDTGCHKPSICKKNVVQGLPWWRSGETLLPKQGAWV